MKHCLRIGCYPQPGLQDLDEPAIDMVLVDHEPVQFDHTDAGRQDIEGTAETGIGHHLLGQREQSCIQISTLHLVSDASLGLLEFVIVVIGGAPFINQSPPVGVLPTHHPVFHKVEIVSQRRSTKEPDLFTDFLDFDLHFDVQ